MQRTLSLLLTLFALTLGGALKAQQDSVVPLQFRVYPPDTKIYRKTGGGSSKQYLGTAREPIMMKREWLERPSLFVFERPGFTFPADLGWPKRAPWNTALNSFDSAFPVRHKPAIEGVADSPVVALRVALLLNPWPVLLPVALLLLGGFSYRRARHERQQAESLERKRRSLVASFDGTDPLIGKTLGAYLVMDRLGEGGMATVYKAVPSSTYDLQDVVAIKVMQSKMAGDQEFRRRFQREVLVSKDLQHPNIVRVDDWGEQDGILYLVLEYVAGETLDRKIPRHGFSLEEALAYLEPTIEALIYAHGRGVVHRDLKPENIMVSRTGMLKVMDFGLARSNDVSKVTKTGSALGTPAYMPPEQITGAAPRPASDQYAFGVLTYELLTGRRPFDDPDMMTVLFKHLSEPPTPLREWKPSLPESLELLVGRMLEKEPGRRLPTMEDVRDGLLAVASGRPWLPPEPPVFASRETGSTLPPPSTGERETGQPTASIPTAEVSSASGALAPPTVGEEQGDSTVGFAALSGPPAEESDATTAFQALGAKHEAGPAPPAEDDGTIAFQALAGDRKEGD